jgi:hypothetical protein
MFTPADYKPPEMPSGESRAAAIVAVQMYGSAAVRSAFSDITVTTQEFVEAADTLTFQAAHPGWEPDDGAETPHSILARSRKRMATQLDGLAELVASEVQSDLHNPSS